MDLYIYLCILFRISNLIRLAEYCDEFLVHGVDVEGKKAGIEEELVALLGDYGNKISCTDPSVLDYTPIPITYAGGVRSIEDLEMVKRVGGNKVDCTVGSALDMFGGDLPYDAVISWHRNNSKGSS